MIRRIISIVIKTIFTEILFYFSLRSSSSIKQATNEIIAPNPTLFQENKNYSFDDHTSSTTSEMSGHDSESIYLFPSKKQCKLVLPCIFYF